MTNIADIIVEHAEREGPLLPILHDVQKAFGHVSEDAIRSIAQALNLTRAEVFGVVSFYHDFHKNPETRPILKLCRAEACQARGAEALAAMADGQVRVKVEAVYCLGLCAVGPAAMAGNQIFARLDQGRFAALMETI